jgi:mitotic spindle assembly checkpoint protein MAD2B
MDDTDVIVTFQTFVSVFSDFLTVAIHTILYERDIYPRDSFLSAKKYNYSVRQSRHPKVCQWITLLPPFRPSCSKVLLIV